MNPLFLIDFYKVGHVSQYPSDTKQIWSNWTPRSTRVTGETSIVFFGLQYFIREILQKEWSEGFFNQPLGDVLSEYSTVIRATLGVKEPKTDHIEALWRYQKLPLDIFSLPEGTSVPLRIPALVITNTHPDFFWLPNYFETILSNMMWKACTSASTARRYRSIFEKWAGLAGEKDLGFIDWMGHDFSYRGMSGREDAILSGMAHLLYFSGTDTIPAILGAEKYYGAALSVGGSVPATEHSVMCAGEQENEQETFRRLIEDVYPEGIVSIVSDTWDFWKVLTEIVPNLKDKILARKGKVVIRPDSGDPVKIVCGDPDAPTGSPQNLGALRLLQNALGTTDGPGLPLIRNAGVIYGDSITPQRAEAILARTVEEIKLSPYNLVFGIGSYTYEYVTRDTYGWAMKATATRRGDKVCSIFKKPVTDDGVKDSFKGIPVVHVGPDGEYFAVVAADPRELESCAFLRVFHDGHPENYQTFDEIRERARYTTRIKERSNVDDTISKG